MRLDSAICALLALVLSGCAATGTRLDRGLDSSDTIEVVPVKNLAGVSLKVPEIYLGDAVGRAGDLRVRAMDIKLLAEAALYSRLDAMGRRVALKGDGAFPEGASHELHGAVTHFDMTELRATGRFRMAMAVMLIDVGTQTEVARGVAEEEFQLLDMAPDEVGAIGEERFIEARMQIFIESLARSALDDSGF